MSTHVLVLAGGPDLEHDVSLQSARCIGEAIDRAADLRATVQVVEDITPDSLASLEGDVIWPAMHGRFSEGGPLQDILEADARPFVGSRAETSRIAIDKVLSKRLAERVGLSAGVSATFNPLDDAPPLRFPLVLKPVFEGSTIGLHVCHDRADWKRAHAATREAGWPAMVEPFFRGRELTVTLVDLGDGLRVMPLIEIVPADGLYDYRAKYERDDTRYIIEPELALGVGERLGALSLELARRIDVCHLCRVDFILDQRDTGWFLELNTMPGFTTHSLVPMSCAHAGVPMPELCRHIVHRALADHPRTISHGSQEDKH